MIYDILVLGGGPGGYVAAIKASQLGAKVALIEKDVVGGICLNHGCIPTKTLLKSAKLYKTMKKSEDYGIITQGNLSIDWDKVLSRKNKVVKQLTQGVSFLLKKNKVDVFNGFGEVLSPHEVLVNGNKIQTKKLIIATGSSAIVPPIKGAKEALETGILLTSKELLNIKEVPKTLTIIGGGVIGIEFATIFSHLGTKVTVIEKLPTVLPSMDEEIVKNYTKILKKATIDILTNAEVMHIDKHKVTYKIEAETHDIESDYILMAVGTKANLSGLEKLNLKIEKNSIVTDEFLRTNLEDVYAIGDVNGRYMLAHVASHEGMIAASHAFNKETHPMHYNQVPQCIYGSPEIASIGLTEQQAIESNMDIKVQIFPLSGNGKALADNETDGFIKLITDTKYLEVVGAHILAYNATEMISELGVLMQMEGTAHELVNTIHPHPTLSEITLEAALGIIDKPIHI